MAGIPPDVSISAQAAFKDILERLDRLEQKARGVTSDDIARLRAEIAGQREGKPKWQDPNDVFPGGMISKSGLLLRSIAGGQGIQLDAQGWDLLLQSSFRTVLRSGYDVRIVPGSADESSGHLGAIYLDGDVNVLGTLFGRVDERKALLLDATARTGSGTGETDATTLTVPGNLLDVNGAAIRVFVVGKNAAGGSTRTFNLYWNGSSICTVTSTIASTGWAFLGLIFRTSATAQGAYNRFIHGAASAGLNTATAAAGASGEVMTTWDTLSATLSGPVPLKTTLQDSAAGTNITQLYCSVELLR